MTPAAPPPQRLLIVHNPVAGRRRRRRFEQVLQRLGERGCALELRETGGPGDATALARAAGPEDGDLMVAAGGDGTINEVANGLAAAGPAALPLAILPLGTSNVLAAEIGLDGHPEAVAHTITEGTARLISLGRLESPETGVRLFLMMVGVGVDARAVAGVDPGLKRRFAQGAYVWSGLREVLRSARLDYRVMLDGVRHQAASVIVAKAAHYGGPFVIAPEARLDAAGFQVCLFSRGGVLPVIGYAAAIAVKQPHLAPGYRSLPARRVEITAPVGEPVQCDGDLVARLPVRLETLPDALSLIVPPDGAYG